MPTKFFNTPSAKPNVAIIGGGPAGLFAAEILSQANIRVQLFDRMPSMGRKFLLAGIGGLNITHSEPLEQFYKRYTPSIPLSDYLRQFGRDELLTWCQRLGIETFIGSSGRIFPKGMKAAPLLRAWLNRLKEHQVEFNNNYFWQGWNNHQQLIFDTPQGKSIITADAILLALGGASYPKLGTDGHWTKYLQDLNILCSPWQASNCGFEVSQWSNFFKEKYAGKPVKQVACSLQAKHGEKHQQLGELLISYYGIEGSLSYALARPLREAIRQQGSVTLYLDLYPHFPISKLQQLLAKPRGSQSVSNFLRKQINLRDIKMALVRELAPQALLNFSELPRLLKALPLRLVKARPITEAISTAGGVSFTELTPQLMLKKLPSVFCAGEMLDWEAPTGGYLLTGCFSTGYAAAQGIINYLQGK